MIENYIEIAAQSLPPGIREEFPRFLDTHPKILADVMADPDILETKPGYRDAVIAAISGFRDPCTGVYNRTFLEVYMPLRFGQAVREYEVTARGIAVIAADMIGLKSVNEGHASKGLGYGIGSGRLSIFAHELDRSGRREDVTVRYGGDEFLKVLDRADGQVVDAVCDRFLSGLRTHALEPPLDAYIGTTVYKPEIKTWQELVDQALDALHENKRTRKRNGIEK